jgi:hypothetical protein
VVALVSDPNLEARKSTTAVYFSYEANKQLSLLSSFSPGFVCYSFAISCLGVRGKFPRSTPDTATNGCHRPLTIPDGRRSNPEERRGVEELVGARIITRNGMLRENGGGQIDNVVRRSL